MTITSFLGPSLQALKQVFDQVGGNLTHLSFGYEEHVLAEYKCDRGFLKMPAGVSLDRLMEKMTNSRNVLPELTHLDINGFGVSHCHPSIADLRWTFNFTQLQRLCLESCYGSDVLLSDLTTAASGSTGPIVQCNMRLREFVFRHEAPTQPLKQALESFISSFSGLRLLSVLLDNTTEMIDYHCFMRAHGPTLKVLVWEGRKQSRGETPISLETSDSAGKSFICHLVNNCPNLEELSIALDMRLGYTTKDKSDRIKYGVPFKVFSLRYLKTLHSRVLPSPERAGTNHDFIIHANKAAICSFLDWGHHSQWNGTVAPWLRLVAVGPLSYHDRWMRECGCTTRYGPSGPIFYDVNIAKGMIGEYSHILSPLGTHSRTGRNFINKTVDKIKEDYTHSRVFESYWLK
jgi:tRNA modification GTPase